MNGNKENSKKYSEAQTRTECVFIQSKISRNFERRVKVFWTDANADDGGGDSIEMRIFL